jgi:hypothetical protein
MLTCMLYNVLDMSRNVLLVISLRRCVVCVLAGVHVETASQFPCYVDRCVT